MFTISITTSHLTERAKIFQSIIAIRELPATCRIEIISSSVLHPSSPCVFSLLRPISFDEWLAYSSGVGGFLTVLQARFSAQAVRFRLIDGESGRFAGKRSET